MLAGSSRWTVSEQREPFVTYDPYNTTAEEFHEQFGRNPKPGELVDPDDHEFTALFGDTRFEAD